VAEAEGVLDDHDVSLVVLDLGLPDIDGRELLVRLKGRPGAAEIPVVVLTGKGGDMPRTECLALGAEAFFEKPFDPRSLSAAVSATLKRLTEITLTSRLDPLTGLLNRAAFRDVYVRMQERASRSHEPLSVAILDLDSFKAVNDRHGHAMGDQVLQRTALVLTRFLRRSDAVARWGGEEFTLLLCADPEAACRAVEDALAGLRREEFAGAGGATFHVTFSAGVAPVHKTATLEEAIEVADRALYLAKAAGKDRVLRAEEAPDVGT
jgi:diguanylate cyclase (GGDEF)-like protein